MTDDRLNPIACDIEPAARWLASTPDDQRPRPIVPYLCRVYGLSAQQAIEAIRAGNRIRSSTQ